LNKDATFIKTGMDRYGRMLGTLYLDSVDINLFSIKSGCSRHFKRYSSDQKYAGAEEFARIDKIGLWGLDDPIPSVGVAEEVTWILRFNGWFGSSGHIHHYQDARSIIEIKQFLLL
jgi:hypothetical protein